MDYVLFTSCGRAFMRANYLKSIGALWNHRRILFAAICVCFFIAGSLASPAFATTASSGSTAGGSFTVFGPKTYTRQAGKPKPVVATFSVSDVTVSYTLKINIDSSACKREHDNDSKREDDERERGKDDREHDEDGGCINRAEIILNGKQVVGPRDFHRHVLRISESVRLLESNTLSVELRGKPGGTLVLEIIGKRSTPPPQLTSITPASGPTTGGATINLSGNNFLSGATVRFGNLVATSAFVVNSNAINATTPPHGLGVVDVSVVNPDGQTSILANAYTYTFPSPTIVVTSITSGDIVSGDRLSLSGTIIGPNNTGITVNGIVANIFNGMFYVNNLLLQPGSNTITAIASTVDGQQVAETLNVTSSGSSPFRVTVSPQSGVAPLKTSFAVTNHGSSAIQSIAIDFNGDGVVDFSTTDRTIPIEFTYVAPGVYRPKIFVTDSQGATSDQTLAVVVLDTEQMDTFFKSIWDGLNSDLVAGNLSGTNRYLNSSAQTKYLKVFQTLLPHMAEITASYSPLQRVSISENFGEYAVNRMYLGQNRLYLIYFLRGADGVWRLDTM